MAEIKSTLELVMERTKHLHMTEADRKNRATEEFRDSVRGLALKYLDGRVSLREFQTNLNQLAGAGPPWGKAEAAAEIGALVDPDSLNEALIELLKEGLGLDTSDISAALHHFHRKLDNEEDLAAERTRSDLAGRGISGAAVIPNPNADKSWPETRRKMLDAFRMELSALIQSSSAG